MVVVLKRISQRHIRLILEGACVRRGARLQGEINFSLAAPMSLGVSYGVSSPAALRWVRWDPRSLVGFSSLDPDETHGENPDR